MMVAHHAPSAARRWWETTAAKSTAVFGAIGILGLAAQGVRSLVEQGHAAGVADQQLQTALSASRSCTVSMQAVSREVAGLDARVDALDTRVVNLRTDVERIEDRIAKERP